MIMKEILYMEKDNIVTLTLNRPERLNALSEVIREGMSEAFTKYEKDSNLEVAILTGEGRGFCAGEDMKESLERGDVGSRSGKTFRDPFMERTLQKPVTYCLENEFHQIPWISIEVRPRISKNSEKFPGFPR